MKYGTLVKAVLRQNQSYTGKEIKEMTLKRMQNYSFNDRVSFFYNRYFGDDPDGYIVNPDHEYYIRQSKSGDIYLKRVRE